MTSSAAEIEPYGPEPALSDAPVWAPIAPRPASRLFTPRALARVRIGADLVLLGLAGTAATLAAPGSLGAVGPLAAVFPVIALLMLHARRTPDERIDGSALDTVVHVLGMLSFAAMLTLAADVIVVGGRPSCACGCSPSSTWRPAASCSCSSAAAPCATRPWPPRR
jgi:hypothetical protein